MSSGKITRLKWKDFRVFPNMSLNTVSLTSQLDRPGQKTDFKDTCLELLWHLREAGHRTSVQNKCVQHLVKNSLGSKIPLEKFQQNVIYELFSSISQLHTDRDSGSVRESTAFSWNQIEFFQLYKFGN
jgi:hypothetical protein